MFNTLISNVAVLMFCMAIALLLAGIMIPTMGIGETISCYKWIWWENCGYHLSEMTIRDFWLYDMKDNMLYYVTALVRKEANALSQLVDLNEEIIVMAIYIYITIAIFIAVAKAVAEMKNMWITLQYKACCWKKKIQQTGILFRGILSAK